MIWGYRALTAVFNVLVCCIASSAMAQPTLPEIAAKADSGIVTLAWTSQYSTIKSISVLRSYDSINYKTIGQLKHPVKGVETYTDDNPVTGKNFYKLDIVFSSGLTWKSNYCIVHVKNGDVASSGIVLPGSAPIQNAPDIIGQAKTVQSANATPVTNPPAKQSGDAGNPMQSVKAANVNTTASATAKGDADRGIPNNIEDPVSFFTPIKYILKPTLNYIEDSTTITETITSRYISSDSQTGNINIDLPGDMGRYHYTVKFYDEKGAEITDIPRISVPNIIMDKRNFQHKGTYEFIIRRDAVEFEAGYIKVIPNP